MFLRLATGRGAQWLKGDEGSYLPNCQTTLVMALNIFCFVIS